MKQNKKSFTLILMTSSIILLLVLQVSWLASSYEKANSDLRRRTNTLFRGTIFALRDSFFVRNVEVIAPDSAKNILLEKDTVFNERKSNHRQHANIQFFGSTPYKANDSASSNLPHAIISKIQREHIHGRNRFLVRMGADSLSLDTVRVHFQKTLLAEGIEGSFRIKHTSTPPPLFEPGKRLKHIFRDMVEDSVGVKGDHAFTDSLVTDWVHYNPIHRYAVELFNFRSSLIQEILPQVLFSLFLTIMTLASFFVLYKNILSQQRLMELKNDFISNMTHELKTPIATVSVALEALKSFNGIEDPKKTEEYLDMAQHELNRLTMLTDNVLTTSLFEAHGVDYIPEPVDMEKTIQQVIFSLRLVFEKSNASVQFEKNGNDFMLIGSSIHLTNVIYNLVDNALKYSLTTPNITITLSDINEKLRLVVKDHGIGIAPGFKNKIFDKFFRVPTGNVHNIKGYGLGLSYVQQVIKEHGGTIAVESEPGSGTQFIIVIPKRKI